MAQRNVAAAKRGDSIPSTWGLNHELLSREEERKLAIRAKEVFLEREKGEKCNPNATRALQRLVACNQRLVASIARQLRSSGKNPDDLMGYGNLGLLLGIQKFDPNRKLRLGTYVSWWIRACIHQFIRDDAGTIRIPISNRRSRIFYGLGRARQQLEREGRAATTEALAEKLGVSEKLLVETLQILKTPLSLDASYDPGDERTLGDSLYIDGPTPEEAVADAEEREVQRQAIQKAFAVLNPRERRIIEARYLGDGKVATLNEVGRKFGLSQERIRQIELEAKKKLAPVLNGLRK